jgi:DNA-binding NtrC family response regulator
MSGIPKQPNARLMVIDDDVGVAEYLAEMLTEAGYAVDAHSSPLQALAQLEHGNLPDLILTDLEMPQMRGLDLLDRILQMRPGQLVVLITAFGSIDVAVQAVRAGATDFLAKPFAIEQLLLTLERALRERAMRREIVRLRSHVVAPLPTLLVARSPAMHRAVELARRAARAEATVLICGESGVGKGQIARFIHDQGPRATKPYVHLSCGVVPPALAEAELFGVATSGALREGALAQAHGGTLFLDEVGQLPTEVQPKLLHALEQGKYRPVGSDRELDLDVRIVAATDQPLENLLRDRRFRPDLYYRLNVVRIEVLPLRERPDDVHALVDACLHHTCNRLQRPMVGISSDALRWMMRYPWPGNARELVHLIERAVAMTDHDTIILEDLAHVAQDGDDGQLLDRAAAIGMSLEEVERAYIRRVLELTLGNKSVAARMLGIDRRTLYRKLNEADDEAPNTL